MPNDLSAFKPQIWSKRLIMRLDQINVMLGLVNRNYEGDIRQVGDTVKVRTLGDIAIGKYVRGGQIDYSSMAPAIETLTINDANYFAISVDDLDVAQDDINALDNYRDRAVIALNNVIETKLLGYYSLARSKLDNNGAAYMVDTTNAYSLIVQAGKALDKLNAPQIDRTIIVDPDWKAQLLQDAKNFIRSTDMGDMIVRTGLLMPATQIPGLIGEVAGFKVYCSNALPTLTGGAGVAGTYCQFFQGTPISYAAQLRAVEDIRLESTFGSSLRGLLLHDATVFAEDQKRFGTIRKVAA